MVDVDRVPEILHLSEEDCGERNRWKRSPNSPRSLLYRDFDGYFAPGSSPFGVLSGNASARESEVAPLPEGKVTTIDSTMWGERRNGGFSHPNRRGPHVGTPIPRNTEGMVRSARSSWENELTKVTKTGRFPEKTAKSQARMRCEEISLSTRTTFQCTANDRRFPYTELDSPVFLPFFDVGRNRRPFRGLRFFPPSLHKRSARGYHERLDSLPGFPRHGPSPCWDFYVPRAGACLEESGIRERFLKIFDEGGAATVIFRTTLPAGTPLSSTLIARGKTGSRGPISRIQVIPIHQSLRK
jgi:hypothetical protein